MTFLIMTTVEDLERYYPEWTAPAAVPGISWPPLRAARMNPEYRSGEDAVMRSSGDANLPTIDPLVPW